jgi:CheY-like chemotaxis protein/zinc transporter ZupT
MIDQFTNDLRGVLNHLYDPDYLRGSSLAVTLGVSNRGDTPVAMQHILEDAITALKPKKNEQIQPHNRRIYDLLSFRYIDQYDQKEVANQLGISLRQFRREQEAALKFLALRLWERYQPDIKNESSVEQPVHPQTQTLEKDELTWLSSPSSHDTTDLIHTLDTVLELVHSLSTKYNAKISLELSDNLPALALQTVTLRQILLNLLSVAIHRAPYGQIVISATIQSGGIGIQVRSSRGAARPDLETENDRSNLNMAAQLVKLCGGQISLESNDAGFEAALVLPAVERLSILAVDDSLDTVQLWERYISGTRYQLINTQDPEQCLELAERHHVQAVILDLMIPQMDGWEVLSRLRNNPPTAQLPIMVCSILHQEELALTLGADLFLRKPITRYDFLASLDRLVAKRELVDHSSSG